MIQNTFDSTNLSLAKGYGVKLLPTKPFVVRKFQETHGGVSARGQHKDEGRAGAGVIVGPGQIKGRWLHKFLPQLLHDELRDSLTNLRCRENKNKSQCTIQPL